MPESQSPMYAWFDKRSASSVRPMPDPYAQKPEDPRISGFDSSRRGRGQERTPMTGVELTEEEVALLDEAAAATILAVANDMSTTEEVLNAVAQIIEARLAVMNEAAVAAIRAEAENHRLEAEVERLTAERDEYERRYDTAKFQAALAEDRAAKFEALVEAGLGLIRAEADKYDHPNQWVARDLLHSVANRVAALGGAK